MAPKKKHTGKVLHITEKDFMKANRRAARLEEIAAHGKPVSLRTLKHRSKKTYTRKQKHAGLDEE